MSNLHISLLDRLKNEAAIFLNALGPECQANLREMLIANNTVPLRGNYTLLPALLSTLSTAHHLLPKNQSIALIIDDDSLCCDKVAEIHQTSHAIHRQYAGSRRISFIVLSQHTELSLGLAS